jgi:hypothetical protein
MSRKIDWEKSKRQRLAQKSSQIDFKLLNKKFTQLPERIEVLRFLKGYSGCMDFLCSLQKQYQKGSLLTDKQIISAHKIIKSKYF